MSQKSSLRESLRLEPEVLKREVDPATFDFETTEEVPELEGIIGQDRGNSVIRFGLHVDQAGYNIYIAGLPGTGKTTFANKIVKEFADRETELYDWAYVYNFEDSYRP